MRNIRYLSAILTLVLGFQAGPAIAQDPTIGYWDPRFEPADLGGLGFQRLVEAMAVDPVSGDVFVGGGNLLRFTGEPVVRWTGSGWASVGGSFNNAVNALAFAPDGTLYAGGNFTTIDGSPAGRVARLEGGSWIPLGNGVNGAVFALTVDPATGHLYVGGNFTQAEQTDGTPLPTRNLVKWTGTEWERVGHGGDGHRIDALAFDPISGDLFVGGYLSPGLRNTDSTLVAIQDLGRFDGDTWVNLEDPAFRLNIVNAIAFDSEGQLYVAHNIDGGLAFWDRADWSMPAGGLGYIQPNGVRTGDNGTSLSVGDGRVYVGGGFTYATQPDGSTILARGVVAYDPKTDRFEALGEGVHRSSTATHIVAALVARPDGSGGHELFIGGTFTDAGARPAANIARWTSTAPFHATEVTFQTDLRTPMRLGLFGGLTFLYPTARRPMVDVLSTDPPERYVLFDPDGDSVWTARITLPRNVAIDYAYAMEFSGTGFERGTDWIYELTAPDGETRSAALTDALLHTLPVVPFDGMPPRSVDPGYIHRVDRNFDAGNPGEHRYPAGGSSGVVRIDPEALDRPMNVAVRWYQEDPGGAPPDGIVAVAQSAYWSIAHIPQAADYTSTIWFDYGEIPGIAEPADLRLLWREDAASPWQVVPADVNSNDLLISTVGLTRIGGDWTVGSVSAANPLSSDPPELVHTPTPGDGALAAPIRPLFRWEGGFGAGVYDLYLWPEDGTEPASPTRGNLPSPGVQPTTDLVFGTTYNWRIVAQNINGDTPGPVWSFTVGTVPDLTTSSVEVPAGGFSGQEITVNWTVANVGDGGTNVPSWTDEVFLSGSATFDPMSAILLGSLKNLRFLNPGESYTNSHTVALPQGVQGPMFVHVVSDGKDQMDEADESNNRASNSLNITLTPYADLEVTNILLPANVFSGDSVDVSFTVTNVGAGQTGVGTWFDSIFLSTNDQFDYNFASGDGTIRIQEVHLGTWEHTGTLDPGLAYDRTVRVKLPDDAIGSLTVFVAADIAGGNKQPERGDVYEFSQEFDNWSPKPIDITLTPPPDLTVSAVTAPATAVSGETIEVSWTVTNSGPGATAWNAWSDRVYYSPTASLDPDIAVYLGTFSHVGVLENDADYANSGTVRLPDGISGSAHFHVVADWKDDVFEYTFEDNNWGVTDLATEVSVAPYPDLDVLSVLVSPGDVTAGEEIAVQYAVSNSGTAPTSDPWVDSVYVSNSAVWDRSLALPVAVVASREALQPGMEVHRTIPVALPASLTGDSYVFVQVNATSSVFEYPDDESDVLSSGAISVAPYPSVDLAPQWEEVPASAESGAPVLLVASVRNAGDARTVGRAWIDRVYLSPDNALDAEVDVLLAEFSRDDFLASGAAYTYDLALDLPDGTSGSYFVLLQIDAANQEAEAYESNNLATSALTISLAAPADLRVVQFTGPAAASAGAPITFDWTVQNAGVGPTGASAWYDALYLSVDKSIDRTDVLLGTARSEGVLGASESYDATLLTAVPAFSAGPYYVIARADSRDDVYEHLAEGNNTVLGQISLTLPEPSDLVVENVAMEATAQPGMPVEVSWTLRNAGANPANGLIREGVFISADAEWSPDDPMLGVVEREIDLAPGAAAKSSIMVDVARVLEDAAQGAMSDRLPGVIPGSYYAILSVDMQNWIREADDTNNSGASGATTAVSVPNLTVGAASSLTLANGESRYFQVDLPAGEDVLITTTGGEEGTSSVELTVTEGVIPTSSGCCAGSSGPLPGIEPFQVNQEVVVTDAGDGPYFVLVRADGSEDGEVSVDLAAEVLDFQIRALSSSSVGPGPVTISVKGSNFTEDTEIVVRAGGDEFRSDSTHFADRTLISARMNLTGSEAGPGTVVAVQGAAESAPYAGPFQIVPERSEQGVIVLEHPVRVRSMDVIEVEVTVRNVGNTSMLDYLLSVEAKPRYADVCEDPRGPSPRSQAVLVQMSALFPRDEPTGLAHTMFTRLEDGRYVLPLWIVDLPPNTTHRIPVQISHNLFNCWFVEVAASLVALPASEFTRTGSLDDIGSSTGFRLITEAVYDAVVEAIGPPSGSSASIAGKTLDITQEGDEYQQLIDRGTRKYMENIPNGFLPTNALLGAAVGAVVGAVVGGIAVPGVGAIPGAIVGATEGAALGGYYDTAATGLGLVDPFEDFIGSKHCRIARETPELGGSAEACQAALDKGDVEVTASYDPNDITGPDGFGPHRFVSATEPMPFRIRFENDPVLASAPAQTVEVRQKLSPTTDIRTFRLGDFGFGSFSFSPPENRSYYRTRVDVADSLGVVVDVTAGIDVTTGEAFWVMRSVDPGTGGAPADPLTGFLPVNDALGRGEGFVDYRVTPAEAAATGDVIESEASIVFDINPPIVTPRILHTVDASPPVSSVDVLSTRQDSIVFDLSWTGQDTGSGIRDFTLYVSIDGEPFDAVQAVTNRPGRLFVGEIGHRYSFFTIARDHVGNVEPMKSDAEAVTVVATEEQGSEVPQSFALHQNFPNPFNPTTTIPFDIAEQGEVRIAVYNVLGQRVLVARQETLRAGRYQQTIDMSQFASGVYFYEIRVLGTGQARFRDVRKFVLVK